MIHPSVRTWRGVVRGVGDSRLSVVQIRMSCQRLTQSRIGGSCSDQVWEEAAAGRRMGADSVGGKGGVACRLGKETGGGREEGAVRVAKLGLHLGSAATMHRFSQTDPLLDDAQRPRSKDMIVESADSAPGKLVLDSQSRGQLSRRN